MSESHRDDGAETGIEICHHATFDPESDDVALAVMDTVASAADVAPTDLEPLTTSLDPDALAALFSEASDGIRVSKGKLVFAHEGYEVTVTSGGNVWVQCPA